MDAVAGGDIVGGDKVVHNHPPTQKKSKLELLKAQLKKEVEDGSSSSDLIDQLQCYKKPIPEDGVIGLVAKLEASGRSAQLMTALEMKEQFAKLLEKWSLYASAQEIFAHLLAMAQYKYSHQIYPIIGSITDVEIDELVDQKIISPAIEEVGIDIFSLDHKSAMGMIYWLAEQCRIKWHK
ncbi:MAG TPA: ABC-three component system protein [Dokdonella sp.]|uniref:ABC-three component system protein n=1 Tax=Dokdonella sp. TaxID=2291710 RepID=UPI002C480F34|nr:ABC-three component system protein [Dokdonella sp.]HUD40749.1 ABC-three component system protein [Dokdonella sp.]